MDVVSSTVTAVTATSLSLTGALMAAASLVVFVAAHRNNNYSWVDRSWSILPVVYTWIQVYYTHHAAGHLAAPAHLSSATLYGLVITVWGCRLTFNFYRRGGYARGGEDYRWNHVHTWRIFSGAPVVWTLFNFFIISCFQTWLLWAITLPVMHFPATPATMKDGVFASLLLLLIALESVCDQQQWRFQCAKARTPRASPYCYGFCVTGVFGYSRHLNVFCEASLWVMLAVAGNSAAATSMEWWQWSGCVVLELLTLFSTSVITERLTARKYPGYAVYQSITPMLFPSLYSTTDRVLLALESKRAQ
ncbi:hypothetical protein NESM_000242400 [Novymonas esmeraldas]|uniref:Steroid 5-alpha reductase C-terminal domain-containing protein n=1 Tax=Novymonas esmeraldas TaxID=1808958 RepID=A0AAW0FB00_9TRYP